MPDPENKSLQEYIFNNFPTIQIDIEFLGERAAEVYCMPTNQEWNEWGGYDGQGG